MLTAHQLTQPTPLAFPRSPALLSSALLCTQIVEVVGHIEAGNILPPLVVLQLLAKNQSIKAS